MKIVEVCEPAFQYICRLNRIGSKGQLDYRLIRDEIDDLLRSMENSIARDPALKAIFEKIRLPLIFLLDSMIVESGISCASEWDSQRLAYDHHELSGDESFFDDLDRLLDGSDPDKYEMLTFFYVCLGLGFTGIYFSQPEMIRDYMGRMEPHLRGFLDSDLHQRIVPDAYRFTNNSNLITPPAPKIIGILLAFFGVALAVFIGVVFLYLNASEELADAITQIDQKEIGVNGQ